MENAYGYGRSLARDLEHQAVELAQIDTEIEKMLGAFEYKLTTMPGVGNAIASKLIAEIGDIRRLPNADKLACFAGIAPKSFSSAGKGREESNKQGNRELHGLFYFLAVTMVCVTKGGKPTLRLMNYLKNLLEFLSFQITLATIGQLLMNV